MAKKVRLFMTLSQEELDQFENAREQLGFNRSQYLRYLISGQKEIRPVAIKERELIKLLAEIERDLKVIAMKPSVSNEEKVLILAKLDDLKKKYKTVLKQAGDAGADAESLKILKKFKKKYWKKECDIK